mmetsp:Transcript_11360/g.36023  ORF Transcript_11360/g.36023 Transcript_11360/m.36023 type:complete len:97 (+) Transcript_11360:593-883(+)
MYRPTAHAAAPSAAFLDNTPPFFRPRPRARGVALRQPPAFSGRASLLFSDCMPRPALRPTTTTTTIISTTTKAQPTWTPPRPARAPGSFSTTVHAD